MFAKLRARRQLRESISAAITEATIVYELSPQLIADRHPTPGDKREWCIARAEEARRRYAQGQVETILDVLQSDSDQFAGMDGGERTRVAKMRWAATRVAKDLVNQDEMYTRWAGGYAA